MPKDSDQHSDFYDLVEDIYESIPQGMSFRVKDTPINRTWFASIIGKIFHFYSHPKGCDVETVLKDR